MKLIKKSIVFLLKQCLPKPIIIQLKNLTTLILSCEFVQGTRKIKAIPANCFRLVPIANQQIILDLIICCAFKGRHEILEKIILESLNISENYNFAWFLCGSTDEDLGFIQKMAAKTQKVSGISWKNEPLGEKWHYCVKTASDIYDAELYAITGSYDMLSSSLINNIIHKHKKKLSTKTDNIPAMYCTNDWMIVRLSYINGMPSAIACSLKQFKHYVPLGAGRFYSKKFMEHVSFNIFDLTRNNCLDDYGYFKAINLGYPIEYYKPSDGLLLSIKGNWQQLNSIEAIINAETIETKDCTFSMHEILKKELSLEMYNYLFKTQNKQREYAWN